VIVIAGGSTSRHAARHPLPILLLFVAACARGLPAPAAVSTVDPCRLGAPPPQATADTGPLTIVLSEPIRPPSASWPPNRSDAIVYRHIYQPLVRADCEGRLEPALLETWVRDEDGRTWRLTLSAGASFADGTPITAHDVVAWIADRRGGANWSGSDGLQDARVDGAREVALTFAQSPGELPLLVADPSLAPRLARGDRWPVGAGPYRLTMVDGSSEIRAAPRSGTGRSLVFRHATGGDLRDALHLGADLLVAEDRDVRDYAATLAGFTVEALPWDRVYVIAVTTTPVTLAPALTDLRMGLARDAVRVESRAAASDAYWWAPGESCSSSETRAPARRPPDRAQRIVFRRDDAVARALAERLVAVAAVGASEHGGDTGAVRALVGSGLIVAHGVPDAEFDETLRSGGDAAYVFSLPHRVHDRCAATLALHGAVPWLDRSSAQLVPLVETRAYVAIRNGAGRVRVDWDGVPVVSEYP